MKKTIYKTVEIEIEIEYPYFSKSKTGTYYCTFEDGSSIIIDPDKEVRKNTYIGGESYDQVQASEFYDCFDSTLKTILEKLNR